MGSIIIKITTFSLDVGGNYQPIIYIYIAPELGEGTNLILGTPWMVHQGVQIEPNRPQLRLSDGSTLRHIEDEPKLVVRRISAQGFAVYNHQR
jgi:hypothetical protein